MRRPGLERVTIRQLRSFVEERVTIRQLRAFVDAAHTMNFARSAQNLGIDGSSFGKLIARLEFSLGVRLFDRKNGIVRGLTDVGSKIYRPAKYALESAGELESRVLEARRHK